MSINCANCCGALSSYPVYFHQGIMPRLKIQHLVFQSRLYSQNTTCGRSSWLNSYCGLRSRRPFSASTAWRVKKYTEDHEWIELDTDGTTGTIGISTYAAKALGDVVYVELPQADTEFNAGDTIGAVESVKSASDILTPVTGTIIEANSILEDTPGSINKSPEGEAWIAKVKVKDTRELDDLMDKEAYDKFTDE